MSITKEQEAYAKQIIDRVEVLMEQDKQKLIEELKRIFLNTKPSLPEAEYSVVRCFSGLTRYYVKIGTCWMASGFVDAISEPMMQEIWDRSDDVEVLRDPSNL